jgi:hypothetical protein
MIAFSALLPASALALVRVGRDADAALPLGDIREAALEHLRQFRADLAGSPDMAEHIHRIVNSTIST